MPPPIKREGTAVSRMFSPFEKQTAQTLLEFSRAEVVTGQKDVDVNNAVEDAIRAAGEGGVGGRRKRGGAFADTETGKGLKAAWGALTSGPMAALGVVDKGLGLVLTNVASIAKVTAGVGLLNHPTVFGNITQLSAAVVRAAANTGITSTWKQWGDALVSAGYASADVAKLLAEQSVQGPVVPFAIATIVMKWRAEKAGKSVTQLIKDDAKLATEKAITLALSQYSAFLAEVNKAKGLGQEKAIADLRAAVAGLKPVEPSASGTNAAAEQPEEIQGAPSGGRRKKKTRRISKKRRMTRRVKKITFAY